MIALGVVVSLLLGFSCGHAQTDVTKELMDAIQQSPQYLWGIGSDSVAWTADAKAVEDFVTNAQQHRGQEPGIAAPALLVRHANWVEAVNFFAQQHLSGTHILRVPEPGRWVSLVYAEWPEVHAISDSMSAEIRDVAVAGQQAERQGELGIALHQYYMAYLLACSPLVELLPDSSGQPTKPAGPSVRRTLERCIRRIEIRADTAAQHGDIITTRLVFHYQGRPVEGLQIFYRDGDEDCFGLVANGEEYIELDGLQPQEKFERMPLTVVYSPGTRPPAVDEVTCLQTLSGKDTVQISVWVTLCLPWMDDAGAAPTPPPILQLAEVKSSNEFITLLAHLQNTGQLRWARERADLSSASLWAAIFDTHTVRCVMEYNGYIFRDVITGTVYKSLPAAGLPAKTVWIQCSAE